MPTKSGPYCVVLAEGTQMWALPQPDKFAGNLGTYQNMTVKLILTYLPKHLVFISTTVVWYYIKLLCELS